MVDRLAVAGFLLFVLVTGALGLPDIRARLLDSETGAQDDKLSVPRRLYLVSRRIVKAQRFSIKRTMFSVTDLSAKLCVPLACSWRVAAGEKLSVPARDLHLCRSRDCYCVALTVLLAAFCGSSVATVSASSPK